MAAAVIRFHLETAHNSTLLPQTAEGLS